MDCKDMGLDARSRRIKKMMTKSEYNTSMRYAKFISHCWIPQRESGIAITKAITNSGAKYLFISGIKLRTVAPNTFRIPISFCF